MTNPAVEKMVEISNIRCVTREDCDGCCAECISQTLYEKGYRLVPELPSVISTAQVVKEAVKKELGKVINSLNKLLISGLSKKEWLDGISRLTEDLYKQVLKSEEV